MTVLASSSSRKVRSGRDTLGVFEHRRADFTLDDEQEALQSGVAAILTKSSTTRQLRDLGAISFSAGLTDQLADFGLFAAGLPEERGGAGAGLGALVAAAEVLGEAMAPVPFADMIAGPRALVAATGDFDRFDEILDGSAIVTVAFDDLARPQLLPAGSVAPWVIGWLGSDLVVVRCDQPGEWVPNAAGMPLSRWAPGSGRAETVLKNSGALHSALVAEWRLLTAAAIVGIARTALGYACDFAVVRETRGIPIGALQAISHKLADVKIALDASGNLVRQAAWYRDNDPLSRPELPALAFVGAVRAASFGVHTAVHVQGGQGVSIESDVTLAFTRARAWPLFTGNPDLMIAEAGESIWRRSLES
jgi:alkylation response protein AidB-like acyl-CoA dehydrogenase